MCFSPEASFIASGGLAAVGVGSLKFASKKQKLTALISLLFAVQQGLEGVQWLFINRGEQSLLAGYGFVFFAYLLWPVYVPVAMYYLDRGSRKILRWFIAMGAVSSLLSLIGLIMHPLNIHVVGQSIDYGVIVPVHFVGGILYSLAVFGALLMSHKPLLRLLDSIVLLAAVIAQLFYSATFASVWCFFAAITSSLILWYIYRSHKRRVA